MFELIQTKLEDAFIVAKLSVDDVKFIKGLIHTEDVKKVSKESRLIFESIFDGVFFNMRCGPKTFGYSFEL